MATMTDSISVKQTLAQRRQRLAQRFPGPVLLWSGQPVSRNFPANVYPFRASSHFLYFAGYPLGNAVLKLDQGQAILFMDDAPPGAALWHGPTPSRDDWATILDAVAAYPLRELAPHLADGAVLPAQVGLSGLPPGWPGAGADELTAAIAAVRLCHDPLALEQITAAAAVSMQAHRAGMAATPQSTTEAQVRAAMEQVIIAQGMTCAYNSIVTTHGEVLHNEQYGSPLLPGDLLLADVGAEAATGWASDITRTWPVSGRFSPSQRAIYDIVLAAHDACIAAAKPGMEYRDIHLLACYTLTTGLVDLGILRGRPEDLVAQDVHALFFPHGVGHLLGLDVHDMEDLGDVAGYAPGRDRCDRFGFKYLRLDRPLAPDMVVTIEPGFYQVPGILAPARQSGDYDPVIDWERLGQFQDVRGIRIEDDIQITEQGCKVLTAELPTQPDAVEAMVVEPLSPAL